MKRVPTQQAAGLTKSCFGKTRHSAHAAAWMIALALVCTLQAGPRSSTNYSIATDSTDSGGQRASSPAYSNDGSTGGVSGVSSVVTPMVTVKAGYIGQLYEVATLQLSSSPITINETGTLQLSATQLLNDATTIKVPATSVTWSVQSGPLTSISSGGLATAGLVYQDSSAVAQGSFAGLNGTLNLTVLNSISDNFGTYASDGIDDTWQTQYFGQNNPQAAADYVSDGSGLTNLFKYTAGLTPNNAASTFNVSATPIDNQPGQWSIVFSPSLTDRTYEVLVSTDLIEWPTLSGPFAGNGSTQTITDTNATGERKFYKVKVSKP